MALLPREWEHLHARYKFILVLGRVANETGRVL